MHCTPRRQPSTGDPIICPVFNERIKIAEFDFVYTVASTNIKQSSPNLVEMYVTIRSRMGYTMDLIRTEHLELSDLEL